MSHTDTVLVSITTNYIVFACPIAIKSVAFEDEMHGRCEIRIRVIYMNLEFFCNGGRR